MPKQGYTLINKEDKNLSPMMGQNMEAVGQDYRITRIVFDEWRLLICVCAEKIPRGKKMFAFFLLLQLSTYPFYKESRPTKRDMDAPVGFRLSWRSFEHDSLTSGHTRSAPHITFCKTEFEDRTSMGSRKILPVNPSEFVVTSN